MKYIKFFLTRGDTVTLPEDKALAVLNSSDVLIRITDEKGEWTGDTIHKSHIVQTVRDWEKEKEQRLKAPRIDEPRSQGPQHIGNIARNFRPSFMSDKDIDR